MTNHSATVSNWTENARRAALSLATASAAVKNATLLRLAQLLEQEADLVLAANTKDVAANRENLTSAEIDRLIVDSSRLHGIAEGVREVAALPDPVGESTEGMVRPNGLRVMQVRIPLGVILMIFESRPNVAVDAGSLCLKSGNAVLLRGGRESLHTCLAFRDLFRKALAENGLDSDSVQVIDNPDRALVSELLGRSAEIDLVIPRGGESLIRAVTDQSKIPVIQHFKGVCHTYVDASAGVEDAVAIAVNGKVHRPGVCNATETVLFDRSGPELVAPVLDALREAGVEVRACTEIKKIVPWCKDADESDWDAEYLDLIVAVKMVEGVAGACSHIARYGSNHTEAIVAKDWDACTRFMQEIQSSTVVINASTRFADGGQLGLGAEIGISTSKLHAYGPMGLRELTTKKFVVLGNGQVRS